MPSYHFVTNCIHSTAEAIHQMTDDAREITWRTFTRHVSVDELKALFPFYDWSGSHGLHLSRDWSVSYWKSTYQGRPCYYVDHSRIEYIFCQEEVV